MKNEVAGMSLGFPASFASSSSLRKPIFDANANSVADVRKGKVGCEHYGSEKLESCHKLNDIDRNRVRCYSIAPTRCMTLNLTMNYAAIINFVMLQHEDFSPRTATPLEVILEECQSGALLMHWPIDLFLVLKPSISYQIGYWNEKRQGVVAPNSNIGKHICLSLALICIVLDKSDLVLIIQVTIAIEEDEAIGGSRGNRVVKFQQQKPDHKGRTRMIYSGFWKLTQYHRCRVKEQQILFHRSRQHKGSRDHAEGQ
nr:alpha/beta hydrolases superfamily protein [Tanacetum cinerariifolium]